jgi:cell division protein FtsW
MLEIVAPRERAEPARAEAPPPCSLARASVRLSLLVAALTCLGLVMVASAAAGAGFASALAKRSALTAAGLMAFLAGSRLDYHWWGRHSLLVLALAGAALLAVLIPGIGAEVNGARRWINPGLPIGFQPSEFAKVALCIWAAAYCARNLSRLRSALRGFVVPVAVIGMLCLLILAEPDFGTAVLTGALGLAILLAMGTRLVFVLLGGVAALPLFQRLVLDVPYRMRRVMAFLDPWADPRGAGYQLIQSKIAIGSGGLVGRGLGAGLQKAGFLPGADNDFVFSILAEELGLAGSLAVVVLFLLLLYEGLRVVLRARDPFGFALALGLSLLLGMQAAAHVAVVSGAIPTKGLSLPFVSAGGSSLIASLLAAGILVNIARSEEDAEVAPPREWSEAPGYEVAARRVASGCGRLAAALINRISAR